MPSIISYYDVVILFFCWESEDLISWRGQIQTPPGLLAF